MPPAVAPPRGYIPIAPDRGGEWSGAEVFRPCRAWLPLLLLKVPNGIRAGGRECSNGGRIRIPKWCRRIPAALRSRTAALSRMTAALWRTYAALSPIDPARRSVPALHRRINAGLCFRPATLSCMKGRFGL